MNGMRYSKRQMTTATAALSTLLLSGGAAALLGLGGHPAAAQETTSQTTTTQTTVQTTPQGTTETTTQTSTPPLTPPTTPEEAGAVRNQIEVTQAEVRTHRKEIVGRYMNLTDTEAKRFWPIYDSYQKDIAVAQQRMADTTVNFAKNYDTMTDADASQILTDYLNNEKNILDRKRMYVGRFKSVIPAKKVLRLYQLEERMDAATRYNLAGSLPLAK